MHQWEHHCLLYLTYPSPCCCCCCCSCRCCSRVLLVLLEDHDGGRCKRFLNDLSRLESSFIPEDDDDDNTLVAAAAVAAVVVVVVVLASQDDDVVFAVVDGARLADAALLVPAVEATGFGE